jgi:hypothetical protein
MTMQVISPIYLLLEVQEVETIYNWLRDFKAEIIAHMSLNQA